MGVSFFFLFPFSFFILFFSVRAGGFRCLNERHDWRRTSSLCSMMAHGKSTVDGCALSFSVDTFSYLMHQTIYILFLEIDVDGFLFLDLMKIFQTSSTSLSIPRE